MSQLIAPGQGFDAWARDDPALPAHAATRRHPATVDLVDNHPVQSAGWQLGEVQLQTGDAFTLPAAAAVANAVYDATEVRLRSAPFSGEQIALALAAREHEPGRWRRIRKARWIGTAFTLAMSWRPTIAPVPKPDPNLYSASTIKRRSFHCPELFLFRPAHVGNVRRGSLTTRSGEHGME
jgi:nicotinate dehydrogenase subunit B